MKKILILIVVGMILGSTIVLAASKFFSDVPAGQWYSGAVASLSEKGIISGYSDGTFGPGKNVSRAEVAVMLDKTIQFLQTGKTDISVSYVREGLLTNKDKKDLQEKFIKPFVECTNNSNPSNPIVAILITVPQNVGEQYKYNAIAKYFGGQEGFYGKRGESLSSYSCPPEGEGEGLFD